MCDCTFSEDVNKVQRYYVAIKECCIIHTTIYKSRVCSFPMPVFPVSNYPTPVFPKHVWKEEPVALFTPELYEVLNEALKKPISIQSKVDFLINLKTFLSYSLNKIDMTLLFPLNSQQILTLLRHSWTPPKEFWKSYNHPYLIPMLDQVKQALKKKTCGVYKAKCRLISAHLDEIIEQ